MLKVYNSLTREKEPFTPIEPGKIGIYVCGNTVYDHCHLGHARSMVSFDVIVRFLRSQGFAVTYVRNITDIDDKIIVRANERGISIHELTTDLIAAMHKDSEALGILSPDFEPRATDYVDNIVRLIQRLIQTGHAYVGSQGDVYYEVERFAEYGKLAHKDIDGLEAGARVDVATDKRSPLDFVLWKAAKPEEPSWPSPWGEGRPGWHIECSAMAMDRLGEQFDIHGGGLDLQFPHHENEIAQSEGATGKPFANYWLHVGMLQVNHEKMSKSTGNFFTITDVLKKHHPEVIRYFLLSSHYRSALNYSEDTLQNANSALTRLYQAMKDVPGYEGDVTHLDHAWIEPFNAAMNDDFNTPIALSVLFQLSREINKNKSPQLVATLKHLGAILGILQIAPEMFLQAGSIIDADAINQLVAERFQARQQRDWARADEIRRQLLMHGIEIEDGADSSTWRVRS